LAKTFHAKTKRGYDPIEVDAYLELVAAQIDVLHGDIGRLGQSVDAAPVIAPVATAEPSPELLAELEQLRQENLDSASMNAELSSELALEQAVAESLRVENEQLRVQLTAVAPPPPALEPVAAEVVAPEPVAPEGRAGEESYELVLRMAHRTAEDTISQAHNRADEIVAEAEFNAAQIGKESDRKAFEAANRVQSEIAALNSEIEMQRNELTDLQLEANGKREQLRGLARNILQLADGAQVVDLRGSDEVPSNAEA